MKKLESYVEDTPDFLRAIERKNSECHLPSHAFPVSMDITALYPSIPWEKGLEALKNAGE